MSKFKIRIVLEYVCATDTCESIAAFSAISPLPELVRSLPNSAITDYTITKLEDDHDAL